MKKIDKKNKHNNTVKICNKASCFAILFRVISDLVISILWLLVSYATVISVYYNKTGESITNQPSIMVSHMDGLEAIMLMCPIFACLIACIFHFLSMFMKKDTRLKAVTIIIGDLLMAILCFTLLLTQNELNLFYFVVGFSMIGYVADLFVRTTRFVESFLKEKNAK